MSNGPRKKPVRAPQKTNTDKLYDEVCKLHRHTFDIKIKKEEYRPLLNMLKESEGAGTAVDMLQFPGTPVYGRLSEIFPLTEVPRKIYTISALSTRGHNLSNRTVVAIPRKENPSTVYLLCEEDGEVHRFDRQMELFMVIKEERELPYDIRKWSSVLSSLYFRCMYADHRMAKVSDPSRTMSILKSNFSTDRLVQIRRINPGPSRKQVAKIQLETMEHKRKQQQVAKGLVVSASSDGEDMSSMVDILQAYSIPEIHSFPDHPVAVPQFMGMVHDGPIVHQVEAYVDDDDCGGCGECDACESDHDYDEDDPEP